MSSISEYKEKQDSKIRSIQTELLLADMRVLKKLQETFEAGLRDRFSSLSVSNTEGVRELHALIKGSRSFVSWIAAQKNKTEG